MLSQNINRKKIYGIDWLGEDIVGKPIPANYWTEISEVKKIQNLMNADTAFLKVLKPLSVIGKENSSLALKSSLKELNDGKYDLLNYVYNEQMRILMEGTPYQKLSEFYTQRDQAIAQNIIQAIKENSSKRNIFLVGADHRDFAIKAVQNELDNAILLNKGL